MTVTGRIVDASGTAKAGPVSFVPQFTAVTESDVIVASKTVMADENGEFSATLEPGQYRVQITSARPFIITVDGSSGPRSITTLVDAGANYLTLPPGGGTAIATEDDAGIVKTSTTSADPIVPLASEMEGRVAPLEATTEDHEDRIGTLETSADTTAARLLPLEAEAVTTEAAISSLRDGGVNDGSLTSSKLSTADDDAKIQFGNLATAVIAGFGTALDGTKYLGTWVPATNTPTIGTAASNSGKWYVVSSAGTASGTNADGTYVLGAVVVSNGSTWLNRPPPPTSIPSGYVTRAMLGASLDNEVPENQDDFDSVAVWAVLDAIDKIGLWITPAGVVCGHLNVATGIANGLTISRDQVAGKTIINFGTTEGIVPLGDHEVDTADNNDIYAWALVDQDYRLAIGVKNDGTVVGRFEVDEVITARGDEDDLNTRLSKLTNSRGLPNLHHFNNWTLRDWRRLAFDVLLGTSSVQPVIAFFGDSWVWNQNNFVTYLTRRLTSLYGTVGQGFQPFAGTTLAPTSIAGPSDNANGSVSRSGTWSGPAAYDGRGPDLSETTSSTVGNSITATMLVSASSAVIMYLKKSGGGIFKYRVNGGSWTSVNTSNASDALGTATVSSLPSPTITLEIQVEDAGSSGVTMFGVEWKKTGSGVRIHRCGHSGSRSSHWADIGSIWDATVTQLAPHLAFVVLGTNDQAVSVTEDTFKTNIETIVSRLRATRAGMDIVLVAPTENLAGRSTAMTTYRDALLRVAYEQKCAVLDLVRLFGAAATEYNQSSPRNLMDSTVSTVHLTADGNKLAADAMARILTV